MADVLNPASWQAYTSLSVTSVWPYLVWSGVFVAVAAAIARSSAFYSTHLAAEEASARFQGIDGLRGYLALGVFFHHAAIRYFYHVHGRWEVPASRFYTNLGQAGVTLFFMITAFLFWSKGLRSRAPLQVQPFLWTRITRLLPMYLVSAAAVFVLAFTATNFELNVPARQLVVALLRWTSFGFAAPGEINGVPGSELMNNVYWSLRYEWMFYLALPLLLIFVRGIGFVGLVVVAGRFIRVFSPIPIEWAFVFGAVAAVLSDGARRLSIDWNAWPIGALAVTCLISAIGLFDSDYTLRPLALLFVFFFIVANGNTLFGLLRLRASRALGAMSYSIYLLHCIVLYVLFRWVGTLTPLNGLAPERYWLLVGAGGVGTVLLSSLTYRFIEQPLMHRALPGWLLRSHASSSGVPLAARAGSAAPVGSDGRAQNLPA